MGAYLSEPVRDKVSKDEVTEKLGYGVSSMQGWRILQEDSHNCCPDFDEDSALFAVYDGHGGPEVALYTSQNFPKFLQNISEYKKGNLKQALEDAFLEFDTTLTKEEVREKLKELAGVQTDTDDNDEEEAAMLYEEADMPLDQLMKRYGGASQEHSKNIREMRKKEEFLSPMIRARTQAATSEADSKDGDELKTKLEGQLVNGHASECKTSDLTPDSTDCVGSSTKSASIVDNNSECISSSNSNTDTVKSKTEGGIIKADGVTCSSSEAEVGSSRVGPSGDMQGEKGEGGVSSSTAAGASTVDRASSSSTAASSSSGTLSGSSSAAAAQEENEPCSSSGRTRKKRAGIIPVDDEDESSFDSDEEDSEDSDSDDDNPEPWKSGSDDDDSEEEGPFGKDCDKDDEVEEQVMTGGEDPGKDSGCTAVVAVLKGKQLLVANAGDSRCVLCRGGNALDLSEDHKPEDDEEYRRIKKAGGHVTPDGRVNGGLNLSRALGDHIYKMNSDLPDKEQMITALPDVREVMLTDEDDFMVLACDGIWNVMSSQDVVDFVNARLQSGVENYSDICNEMFDLCLAPDSSGDGTGCDNMTCIIVVFNKDLKNKKAAAPEESEVAVTSASGDDKSSVKRKAEDILETVDSSTCKKSKTDN